MRYVVTNTVCLLISVAIILLLDHRLELGIVDSLSPQPEPPKTSEPKTQWRKRPTIPRPRPRIAPKFAEVEERVVRKADEEPIVDEPQLEPPTFHPEFGDDPLLALENHVFGQVGDNEDNQSQQEREQKAYEYRNRMDNRHRDALERRRRINAGKQHRYSPIVIPIDRSEFTPRSYDRYGREVESPYQAP